MSTGTQRNAERAAHLVSIAGIHLAGGRLKAAHICLGDVVDQLADYASAETLQRAGEMLERIARGDYSPARSALSAAPVNASLPTNGKPRHIKVNKANRRRRKLYLRQEFARLCGKENRSHAYAERFTQCSHWEACTTVRFLKRNGILPKEPRR